MPVALTLLIHAGVAALMNGIPSEATRRDQRGGVRTAMKRTVVANGVGGLRGLIVRGRTVR
jgi:hypothetical protein